MSVTTAQEFAGITAVSQIARQLREYLRASIHSGVTTEELDALCRREMKGLGARSAPMDGYDAPCYAFYSVNECVVHGLPNRVPLRDGDLVKIDVTPSYGGFIADTACSVVVGGKESSTAAASVAEMAEEAFAAALDVCRVGMPVNGIGRAVERTVRTRKYHIVPDLTGHGVGRAIHEEPTVFNQYEPQQKDRLTEGLVIAIEPMVSNRRTGIRVGKDGWSISALKGSLTAHHEHTVMITRNGPVVLTA